jgi:hypothetical protein
VTVPIWVPIVLAVLALGGPLLIFLNQRRTTTGEIGTSAAADVWKAAESQLVSYQVELKEAREEGRLTRVELKETRVELKESREEGLLTRTKMAEVSDKLTVSNELVTQLQDELRKRNSGS